MSGDVSGDEQQLITSDSNLRQGCEGLVDVAGWQKRGLTGLLRRGERAWLNVGVVFLSPGPKHDSTSTFLANGIKRHAASVPSAGCPLPSTKKHQYHLISSRLAAYPRSCAVSLPLSFCLEHPLTPLSACCQSSNNYPPLHTLPTRLSKHSQRHL